MSPQVSTPVPAPPTAPCAVAPLCLHLPGRLTYLSSSLEWWDKENYAHDPTQSSQMDTAPIAPLS